MLALSLAASAFALWRPKPEGVGPAISMPVRLGVAGEGSGASNAASRPESLPERLPVSELGVAEFDPFAGAQPLAVPVPAAAPTPPMPPPVVPPQPQAPPLNYRFLGRFTAPDGRSSIYLTSSDGDVRVDVSTRLKEGYVVEAIDEEGVHLVYPPLTTRVLVPIPQASPSR